MPNKREGSVEWRGGMWQGHLWFEGPPKHRKWVPLEGIAREDRALAKEAAAEAQALVTKHGYVPHVRGLTLNEWMPCWLKLREKVFPSSWQNDRANYDLHIAPELGVLPIKALTRDHGRSLARKLDDRVLAGKMADATARNIWHTATRMLLDATRSNEPGIAVLESNPFRDVEGPVAKSPEREKQLLHPDEFLTLVTCTRVPLLHARLYAFAIYAQMRQAEQLGLDWSAVDLKHGTIHVHETADYMRSDGEATKATKTKAARRIRIEAALAPLLEAMHRESAGTGRVFPNPPAVTGEYGLANMLRVHLKDAGVEREELTERLATRMPIRFHDLRATGVTWRLARGDTPIHVQQDVGHAGFGTTEVYLRLARDIRAEDVFPPLPARLLGAQQGHGSAGRTAHEQPKRALPAQIARENRGRSRDRTCDFVRVKDALYR